MLQSYLGSFNQKEITMKKILIILTVSFLCSCATEQVKPISTKWQKESIGGFNTVYTYVPETNSPIGKGKSLMIVLHGCIQEATDFQPANLDLVAEKYGIVLTLPNVANPVHLGCWDYRNSNKSRDASDYANILALVNSLLGREDLNIDKNQVYVAGLSSGATFAMNLGCVAPDVFAGIGVFAGPSTGTYADGSAWRVDSDKNEASQKCIEYSTNYKEFFSTQIASFAQGNEDMIVNPEYLDINAEAYTLVYKKDISNKKKRNLQKNITETLYADGRVSKLLFEDLGHEWPGGKDASGSYIDSTTINYGNYLAEYFNKYNMRVK